MQFLAPTATRLFAGLDAVEVPVVTRVVAGAERYRLTKLARIATRLGNGWLYPLLSVLLVLGDLQRPLRFLVAASVSLLLAFVIYPPLKTSLGRARPCDYAPSLVRGAEPLDRYSCPSGHAMTAAAYAVPLAVAWPAATPLAVGICAVIGWSRVALGHHYMSDIVAGTILGIVVAAPVSVVVL